MSKICVRCGRAVSHLDLPLELGGGYILCHKCAEDAENGLFDINALKSKCNKLADSNATTSPNDSGMFGNIGSKIKTLTQINAWIGIIISVILGISIMGTDEDLIFIGILTMGLGSLLSWISSFIFFGFGQLIENSDTLIKILNEK